MIRLHTLGETAIQVGRRRLGPEAELVFACTIYLAAHRGRRLPRQTVLEVLWPRIRDENRRHNLRQLLYKLRRTGIPCDADATHVALRPDDVQADYDSYFTPRVADGDGARLDAACGEFLPGYAPTFSPTFTDWLDHRRAEVHAQMRRVQLAVLSSCKQRGDWTEVDRLARRVLELDALNEEATLALAEATAMSGSKAAAVAMLDRYVEELGPGAGEIRLPANLLRRRIADRVPPRLPDSVGLLVGRDRELTILREVIGSAVRGAGGACLLWGEAGLGKTRVATAVAEEAALAGAATVHIQCRSAPPLALLHSIVPKLFSLPGALGCNPTSLEILKKFSVRAPKDAQSTITDAAFQFGALTHAFLDLLDAIVDEGLLVVVLDDSDKLDDASQHLVRESVEWANSKSTAVIATSRHRPASTTWSFRSLQLDPLSRESACLLLDSVAMQLGVKLSEGSTEWCLDAAAGNPFFLQELARHSAAGQPNSALPPSLDLLVRDKIANLSSSTQRLIQATALLGPLASIDRIERLLQLPRHELLDGLDQLQSHNLAAFVDGVLVARHPLLAETALSRCTPASLHALHVAIGSMLQDEIITSHSTSLLSECVHHLRACGKHSAEVGLICESVKHLLATGVADEAANLLSEAFAVDPLLVADDEVKKVAATAFSMAGRWPDVCHLLSPSTTPDVPHHDDFELLLQEARWRLDSALLPLYTAALSCLTDRRASTQHRLAAGVRAIVFADNMCDPERVARAKEALVILPEQHDSISALHMRADIVFECSYGDLDRASALAHLLVAKERKEGNAYHLSHALRMASLPLRRCGYRHEAETYLGESLEISERHRHASSAVMTLDLLTSMSLERGEMTSSRHYLDRIQAWRPKLQEPLLVESINRLELKYQLIAGDISADLERVSLSPDKDSGRRAVETKAISSLAAVLQRRELHVLVLETLLDEHKKTRQYGGQDVVTNLILGTLIALGQTERAQFVLLEYVAGRRERFPLVLHPALTLGRLALP